MERIGALMLQITATQRHVLTPRYSVSSTRQWRRVMLTPSTLFCNIPVRVALQSIRLSVKLLIDRVRIVRNEKFNTFKRVSCVVTAYCGNGEKLSDNSGATMDDALPVCD